MGRVMLYRDRRRAMVVEVKWTARPLPRRQIDALRRRVDLVPELAELDRTYALVSRTGFTGRRAHHGDELFIDARQLKLQLSP